MTRVLVVNMRIPWPLDHGNNLRVTELLRHRDPDIECHLACLPRGAKELEAFKAANVVDSVTVLPGEIGRRRWRRFLRRGDRDYYRLACPDHFRAVRSVLQQLITHQQIEVLVAVLDRCEEYTRNLVDIPRVVDQYDSITLALERQLRIRQNASWFEQITWRRKIALAKSVEEGLGKRCDLITAIAPNDVARLRELNPGSLVERIPNGIGQRILDRRFDGEATRRGIVFWGNLSFPVNRQAVEHFVTQVWRPYLADKNIEFAIVGPNADDRMRALAANTPGIVLPGFVDDLFSYLSSYPVMINPMVTGGGLKNKVLEAFASGRAVVSTAMGVDAFPEVNATHCCIADDPSEQAAAVLSLLDDEDRRKAQVRRARQLVERNYTWSVVSGHWSALLRELASRQNRPTTMDAIDGHQRQG